MTQLNQKPFGPHGLTHLKADFELLSVAARFVPATSEKATTRSNGLSPKATSQHPISCDIPLCRTTLSLVAIFLTILLVVELSTLFSISNKLVLPTVTVYRVT